MAKQETQRRWSQVNRDQLQEVGNDDGVLIGVGRVGVEDTATVSPAY